MTPRSLSLPSVLFISTAAALAVSCASDKKLVETATAAHVYWEDRYERNCVAVKGPPSCGQCQLNVNEARGTVVIANVVQKIGPMPEQERAEVKAIPAALSAACP